MGPDPYFWIRKEGLRGQNGRTDSWKRAKREGTRKTARQREGEPRVWKEGAVRKLARAMPVTMPT